VWTIDPLRHWANLVGRAKSRIPIYGVVLRLSRDDAAATMLASDIGSDAGRR